MSKTKCAVCGKGIVGNTVYVVSDKLSCIKCARIAGYKFPDFSAKVKSKNADKSYVRCEGQQPGHNED